MKKNKKITKNFSWMAGEQVARLIGGFFIGVWVARYLGADDYGVLSWAIAFSSLIGIFSNLGLNRAIVRELTLNADNFNIKSCIVSTTFFLRLACSFLCYVLIVAISFFFEVGQTQVVAIVAVAIGFNSFEVVDLYFQSRSESKFSVFSKSIVFFVFLIIKVLLIINDSKLISFAIATSLESFFNAIGLFIVNKKFGIKINISDINLSYGFKLIVQSWPELIAGFACLIFMRIDQLMIGYILNDAAVGEYSVASRLAESWYFVPTALVASAFPAIVQQRENDYRKYFESIQKMLVLLVAVSYFIAIICTLFSSFVIDLLFGVEYKNSANVLLILVWAGLFVSFGVVSGAWIMAEKKPMLNLTRNCIGACVNIGLNFILIPNYGVVGAAIGTLLSLFVAYFMIDFLSKETRCIGFMKLKALFLIWR